jgi:aspartate aminotransferase
MEPDMPIIADRLEPIKPSPTLAIAARAKALQSQGEKIISLSLGEPDFDTPEHIKEAAIKAIGDGFTKYTAADGTVSLKQAVIDKFKRDNDLTYSLKQIIISCGAKHAIYNACQALLNPGDEVVIPAPYWVSYSDIVLLADAKPMVVYAGIEQDYKITPEQLEAAITPKTKLLFMGSPSNPTGVVYSHAELKALAAVLLRHPHVYILSDDIYEAIYWAPEPFANLVMVCPELYDRTLIINGVSKAYCMTGWRIGYTAGPKEIIEAMSTLQSQNTSNPCSISQVAAEAALRGSQQCVADMREIFKHRYTLLSAELAKISGFRCAAAQGAFYLFPDVSECIKRLNMKDDVEFCEHLLNVAKVAVVPGSAFGAPGHIRLSYALSEKEGLQAIKQIAEACR